MFQASKSASAGVMLTVALLISACNEGSGSTASASRSVKPPADHFRYAGYGGQAGRDLQFYARSPRTRTATH